MEDYSVNYLAVLVAGLSSFAIGALWYAPFLFGRVWQKEAGLTDEQIQAGSPAKTFGLSAVLAIIISYGMAMFFGGEANLQQGAMWGFMTGFFFVAASFGIVYLFEQKSFKLWLIDSGYQIVLYTVIGLIHGAWH